MFAQALAELDLDLFGFVVGVVGIQHGFEQFGVEDDVINIIADGVYRYVLVNNLDGLGAQRVPD